MADPYFLEHGVKVKTSTTPNKRPDMSSFFAQLETIQTTNPRAQPTPAETAAAERLLADQFRFLSSTSSDAEHQARLEAFIEGAEEHEDEVEGVPQSYLDELERVDKRRIGKEEVCPICNEKFLDDKYPLVVVLPCHKSHRFDLECVGPWLMLKGTCPMDRKKLLKKKAKPKVESDEEEDDEMGMYS